MNNRKTIAELPPRSFSEYEGKSMMANKLPREYGLIETTAEAIAAAVPTAKHTLRIVIVWDNDTSSLDLGRALDHMRETGAAFVLSVEQVEP